MTAPKGDKHLEEIKAAIRVYPDFPVKGVLFRDIFGVFRDARLREKLFSELLSFIQEKVSRTHKVDAVVGLDARGFLFGPFISAGLNCAFIPARKAGKLPGPCHSASYDLEYGKATLEIQRDALKRDDRVLLLDDLLATGGSLKACVDLVHRAGAIPVAAVVIMELVDLPGKSLLESAHVPVYSLFQF
ncbi:hypothetical protein T265_09546 [Opisthorchis viverrini]|uniref:Adenine phosphoribosyltransferase n=1 Tax=Opisthorchis viverrini TaxID=6198 RepID=A0A074Z5E3_OPIVI|nr:hypothetical protein T265_09546 [Opisthorchis viverrini]KER22351.1 hypothetical protein T265_09546 [Opisthorchis viverrini]